MERSVSQLKIGDLADRCGVSRDTIRYYEREGLLPAPRRTASGYRLYGPETEERLLFIRRAQGIGFSLEDIGELLDHRHPRSPAECRRVAELLRQRLEAVDTKIAELSEVRSALRESLVRCENAGNGGCPVVLDLGGGEKEKKRE